MVPLNYARIMYKNRTKLDTEEKIRTIGSLYDTRNVRSDQDHRVWTYPIVFFYRRSLFAYITIYLFDRPDMQIILHQFLSMLVIAYISFDNHMFKDKPTRFVEIATEVLLFISCLFI